MASGIEVFLSARARRDGTLFTSGVQLLYQHSEPPIALEVSVSSIYTYIYICIRTGISYIDMFVYIFSKSVPLQSLERRLSRISGAILVATGSWTSSPDAALVYCVSWFATCFRG